MNVSNDVDLVLPKAQFQIVAVDRLVNDLRTKFRVTVSKDIRKALYLSVYLISLTHYDEARNLLESFLSHIVDNPSSYVWGDREEGYALLAYVEEQTNNQDKWDLAFAMLTEKNFEGDDHEWILEQVIEDFEWKMEEEPAQMKVVAAELTDSEIREGLVSSIIQFSRHLVLLSGFFSGSQSQLCNSFRSVIKDDAQKLRNMLNRSSGSE